MEFTRISYTQVSEELFDYLQAGCTHMSQTDDKFNLSLERLAHIRANFQDGLAPKDLVILNAIYKDVHPVMKTRAIQNQINEQGQSFMVNRKDMYPGSTAAEFRNATRRDQSKNISDAEVVTMPINYSDEELLATPDHLLNRRELGRKAQLMFS